MASGRATADVLVAEGARVVVSGRDRASLDAPSPSSVTTPSAWSATTATRPRPERLVQTAYDTWGRLDGALISVGGPPAKSVMDTSDEEWSASFDAVFLGAVRIARTVAERLGDGGSIGFVLSSSVREPISGLAISNGLRPGLAMVAKTLADELGPRGIRVNGLMPGRIDTERLQELDARGGDPEASRATRAPGSRSVATGDPRSSAGRRRSCSARRRHSCPA